MEEFDNLKRRSFFTIDPFMKSSLSFVVFPEWHPEIEFIDCSNGLLSHAEIGFKSRELEKLVV